MKLLSFFLVVLTFLIAISHCNNNFNNNKMIMFVLANGKKFKPLSTIHISYYDLPKTLAGGIVVRGQQSATSFEIPNGNYVELGYKPSTDNKFPQFQLSNFTTGLHVTGYQPLSEIKKVIENVIYTSGSTTASQCDWWTFEVYTYDTTKIPKQGSFASPTRTYEDAVNFCFTYNSAHNDPTDNMNDVSIAGLSQSYVEKNNLQQWLGVQQQSSTPGDFYAVSGPKVGQKIANKDGSGCSSSSSSACDWQTDQPNMTSGGVVVADGPTGKWMTISPATTKKMKSWCQDYPVHVWLLCNVDLGLIQKGDNGTYCQYRRGPADTTTIMPSNTNSGGSSSTSSAPAATTTNLNTQVSSSTPSSTIATTTTQAQEQITTTTKQQMGTTGGTTTNSPPSSTTTTTTTVTASSPTNQQQSTTSSSNNNNNNNNNGAAATTAAADATSSPESRAGLIFGVGIVAVLLVVVGLWLVKRKFSGNSNNDDGNGDNSNNENTGENGKEMKTSKSFAQQYQNSINHNDRALMESLLGTV